jgi:Fur family ferric uptake transcriptional regulator
MATSQIRTQDFREYLSRSGLKQTQQRVRIVEAFYAAGQHVSAEELHRRLHANAPGIGLVTVYRTLKLLRQAGLASARSFGDTYARFDPNPAERGHHHLVCTHCGAVQEFADEDLRPLERRVARRQGFRVTAHKLELYGLCRTCARATRPRPRRRAGA